jgi:pimeloyl-ACP methyl ester carboxylesterase
MWNTARIGLAIAAMALTFCTPAAAEELTGAEHWVEQNGVRIYVWEKYSGTPSGKRAVVLAHGSATAGRESFDLQVEGKPTYSMMDFLAKEGFDVFALDTRGFGRSTHPEGHISTKDAADDLAAVVDYVLKIRNLQKVDLLGWSWGTQYAGMYLMSEPQQKIGRYVSFSQMHPDSPDLARRRPRAELFRKNPYLSVPEAGWKPRFYSMTPSEVNDPDVVNAYAKAAAKIELKSATGPQLDMVTIMPMVNPRLINVPVLIIHGQYDDVADLDGLLPFFRQLPNPYKRYVVLPNAGHMIHLQKDHRLFQHEVAAFLKAP